MTQPDMNAILQQAQQMQAQLQAMMSGDSGSAFNEQLAANVARPALQKQITGVALTKTAWYTPMKQVLRVIGIKLTIEACPMRSRIVDVATTASVSAAMLYIAWTIDPLGTS